MEKEVLLKGKIGMSKRIICLGILILVRVIKKFLKSVNPSKVVILKPVIRIAIPVIKGARSKIGEIVSDTLPVLFPSLLSMLADLKDYAENVNEYAKEFKEDVPDLILLLNHLIKTTIESNERLLEAINEVKVPFVGNVELKDMGITISVKMGKGTVSIGCVGNPDADAALTLSTQRLFKILEELKHSAMDAMDKVWAEEMKFSNTKALSKVHQSVVLLDIIEDVLGIPIG
jgi:hypothetical protein